MTWQVGDLAVCVNTAWERCPCGIIHNGTLCPRPKTAILVVGVYIAEERWGRPCRCVALELADGSQGAARRFRKVVSDKHEACEDEFVTLLKRSKVPAIATEARRAETPKSGSVHEGAGPKDIAQDIGGPSQ